MQLMAVASASAHNSLAVLQLAVDLLVALPLQQLLLWEAEDWKVVKSTDFPETGD